VEPLPITRSGSLIVEPVAVRPEVLAPEERTVLIGGGDGVAGEVVVQEVIEPLTVTLTGLEVALPPWLSNAFAVSE